MADNEYKISRHIVKDGDDYIPRKPRRPSFNIPRIPYTTCECGGKLIPRGASDSSGGISSKCNKCGRRIHKKQYKGIAGLVL